VYIYSPLGLRGLFKGELNLTFTSMSRDASKPIDLLKSPHVTK